MSMVSGNVGFGINGTERMRIDSAGNVGIGTSSPNTRFHVNQSADGSGISLGASFRGASTVEFEMSGVTNQQCSFLHNNGSNKQVMLTMGRETLEFFTNNTERARIRATGEIAAISAGDFGLRQAITAGAGTTFGIFVGARSGTAGNPVSGTDTFIVWSNGNVVNTNNSYGAISDAKLKENITDATPKLEKLNQVRIVNFNMKGETQKQLGVIAQELEQIFPGMVDESPDRDKHGNDLGTTTKQVKYSVFVPMLIKAIQELKAELDTVKAELATLKGATE
jgi:hypothetical protein